LPKEASPKLEPSRGNGAAAVQTLGSSAGAPQPKVMTFSQFYASFTAEQKACFSQKVSAERAASLEQGIATITDAELEQLNGCIN
jgi:hypothetical protein